MRARSVLTSDGLLTVAGNAGGVLVVAGVGSAQCLRPRVLDLPRPFRSDDAVVAEAYFASAEGGSTRRSGRRWR